MGTFFISISIYKLRNTDKKFYQAYKKALAKRAFYTPDWSRTSDNPASEAGALSTELQAQICNLQENLTTIPADFIIL